MKEQRITIEISHEGKISADAEGFSGDACLHELQRLLDGLSPGTETVERRADPEAARLTMTRMQDLGKKR